MAKIYFVSLILSFYLGFSTLAWLQAFIFHPLEVQRTLTLGASQFYSVVDAMAFNYNWTTPLLIFITWINEKSTGFPLERYFRETVGFLLSPLKWVWGLTKKKK